MFSHLSTYTQRLALLALLVGVGAATWSPALAHLPLDAQEAIVDQELAKRPHDVNVLLQRAALYQEEGDWDAAIAKTLEAREHGANPMEIDIALADLLRSAGLPHSAEALIENVLRNAPGAPSALLVRARIHDDLHAPNEAAADYFAAILATESPQPGLVVHAMESLVAVGRAEDALRLANHVQRQTGAVVTVVLPAVAIERKAGRPNKALERLDLLLEQSPRHPLWLAERAEILEELGRHQAAAALRQEVADLIAARPADRKGPELQQLEKKLRAPGTTAPPAKALPPNRATSVRMPPHDNHLLQPRLQ